MRAIKYIFFSKGHDPYPGTELKDIGSFVLDGKTTECPPMNDHL